MSGKPAARQGDMTQYGGSIVQGSAGVRIGAPTGVACSVCPGGVTSGHRQADRRSHHRSESGYPHPVCHGPGGQPPARPGAAPGQHPQHVAG